jgi:acetyl esterase/lipase
MQQVYDSFAWLEANADKYNLDLENVFVSGDSAGGHMTACTVACQTNKEYAEKLGVRPTSIKIRGAVPFHGTYDTHLFDKVPIGRSLLREYLGQNNVKDHPLSDYVTPITYIQSGAPDMLIVSGRMDVFTNESTKRLKKGLRAIGVNFNEYHGKHIPNSFHVFFHLAFTKESQKCVKAVNEWLASKVVVSVKEESVAV